MLEKVFPGDSVAHPIFYIPSTESFVDIICRELAYGMVPEFQVEDELESGQLIEVVPHGRVPVSLYWHSWMLKLSCLKVCAVNWLDISIKRSKIMGYCDYLVV